MLIRKDSPKEFSPAKSQYSTSDGKSFMPCWSTSPTLVPGVYDAFVNDYGVAVFSRDEFNDERLVDFPGTNTHKVVEEVNRFWALEEHFKAHGMNYKRGIIMWGPPGSGKSCAIRLVSLDVIRRGGVVLRRFNQQFVPCYQQFREIQPETPLLVLMEDLDSVIDCMDESLVLNVLDGLHKLHKTVFLACHTPDTRLLTKDLRWVPAGELNVGDELWGLDEERSTKRTSTGRETARKFRPSIVVSSFRAKKKCVRVHLKNGESFVCTEDHPWLSYGSNKRGGRNLEWTMAKDLMSRPKLVRAFIPWETDVSYEAGWLAGMMDGEGHIKGGRRRFPTGIGLTQSIGPTAKKMVQISKKYGNFTSTIHRTKKYKDQVRIYSTGGYAATAAIIGTVRSERLIKNFDLTGGIVQSNFKAEVVRVEPVGMQEIQSIETTSRTYFAEGFASHNTTNHPERLGDRIIKRPSRFDRRFYIGHPNREARHAYLKFIWPEIGEDDLRTWANDTKGFSFAHLKELFVAVHMFETPYQDALKTLSNMRKDVLEDGKDAEDDENVKCAVVKCAQTANEAKF